MDEQNKAGRIGIVGIGAMGKPIARNLLRAGYDLAVTWHRNEEPARELEAEGAVILRPLRDLAQACDVVLTVVPGDQELEEVYLGKSGLLHWMRPTGCCIDLTTAEPATIRRLNEVADDKTIDLVDAPVSGGVRKAEAGTLTAMVGAALPALDRVQAILQAFCGLVYHVGDVGAGKAMKMVNQLLVAGNTYMACEALTLAGHFGLDPQMTASVIPRSSGTSWAFENAVMRSILTGTYEGGFPFRLMKKDLEIAAAAAVESGLPLRMTEVLTDVFRSAATPERLEADFPVIYKWLEEQ